jgi:ABC-2 type transport system permease protein
VLRSVTGKTLYERRFGLAGWAAELAGIVALIVAIYPSFAHVHALKSLSQAFPRELSAFVGYGGVVDYTSPVGFLGTELFAVTLPLLMLALAIGSGARAIASEEEVSTLDLLLANPLSRTRLVLEKTAALALELALLTATIFFGLLVATRAVGVHIAAGKLAAAALFVFLLGLLFGSFAVAVGAATGKHALAVGIPSGAAAIAYLLNGVAPLVAWLDPLKILSPFYHYTAPAPLRHGFALGHATVLLAVSAALVVVAVWSFDRRDLG